MKPWIVGICLLSCLSLCAGAAPTDKTTEAAVKPQPKTTQPKANSSHMIAQVYIGKGPHHVVSKGGTLNPASGGSTTCTSTVCIPGLYTKNGARQNLTYKFKENLQFPVCVRTINVDVATGTNTPQMGRFALITSPTVYLIPDKNCIKSQGCNEVAQLNIVSMICCTEHPAPVSCSN